MNPIHVYITVGVTLLIFAVTNVAIISLWAGRLGQRFTDFEVRNEERFARIERAVGITDGNGSAFIRKAECMLMEKYVSGQLDAIASRLKHIEERIAHLERDHS